MNHKNTNPEIMRRLDWIDEALAELTRHICLMTKVTDTALREIEAKVTNLTTVVDAVKAYIDANADAVSKLTDELEAEGADVSKLNALDAAITANSTRLAALIVKGTPADTGTPIPAPVPTP